MTDARDPKLSFTLIGSLAAFLLQVSIAPNIAIFDAVPNFILGFVIINAMFCTTIRSTVTGFLLGLLYDFIAQGPIGALSFVLAIVGYGVSSFDKEMLSESWGAKAFFLLIAAFFSELLHAAFLSILGYDSDFLLSVGMRVVPGTLYVSVFGLIVFPLLQRFNRWRKDDPKALKGKLD
jgi:rod shape-determining protein MreD